MVTKKATQKETCSTKLEVPWEMDVPAGVSPVKVLPMYGPGASQHDQIPADAPRQQEIPAEYRQASPEELHARIDHVRDELNAKIDQVRGELNAKIEQVRDELNAKIDRVNAQLTEKIDDVRSELDAKIERLQQSINSAMMWAVLMYVALAAGVYATMARGFGWL